MSRSATEETSSQQEYALLTYLERLARIRQGRRAVQIHLSRLKSYNRTDYQIRIAINTFETSVRSIDGQLFRLSNQDLFYIYKNASPEEIDDAVMKLRYLFDDDPLTQGIENMTRDDGLCTWWDVNAQYDIILAEAKRLYEIVQRRQQRLAQISGNNAAETSPINPHRLGELVDAIAKADLSNVMRRQTIYAVLTNQPPRPLFRELFISIPDLRDAILPGYNITANRWLFQYLTETLDRRMLSLLNRNDDADIGNAFSLNLNVSTLLSPEFLTFDQSLKQGARGSILIELQVIDIYGDLNAYAFARDFLHERGYRLCIDGMTYQTCNYVDRHKLGADFVKLQWSQAIADNSSNPEFDKMMRALIEKNGQVNTILNRVDNEDAVNYGKSVGIALFQGRYLDQLINSGRPPSLLRSNLRN
jgi:EAL domain-containing protein (putative c-di-GMP-specific phosphodiesterase class I)